MKEKKLKQPSDYPQFYCRMEKEDKKEIDDLLEAIVQMERKVRRNGNRLKKRNDFIAYALKKGLKAIEKKYAEAIANRKSSQK